MSVPVPTLPQSTLAMTPALRIILFVFMLLLGAGLVGIVSAMAREARLGAGETLDPRAKRRGRIAGAIATVVVIGDRRISATCGGPWRRRPTIATSTSRWSRRRDLTGRER